MIEDSTKYLTNKALKEILSELPDSVRLVPNSIKNIAVYDDKFTFLGYIDFLFSGYYVKREIDNNTKQISF